MAKKSFPVFVSPMMANSVKEPFDSPDWIFEMKLDGYRAINVIERPGSARVWSRNGLTLEKKIPAISKALTHLELQSTILDGEIVRPTAALLTMAGSPAADSGQYFLDACHAYSTFSKCIG